MITRDAENEMNDFLGAEMLIAIFGPRQVGKTTLIEKVLKGHKNVVWMDGDQKDTVSFFENITPAKFKNYVEDAKIFVIDEAQRIDDIGIKLKIIHDKFKKDLQIIASGSSSFELANKINEPLTGRKFEIDLYPIKASEMINHNGLEAEKLQLENRMRFGWYPNVISHPDRAATYLDSIVNGNLFKDLLQWGNIRKSGKLLDLMRALAYQVGSVVSLNEISNLISLDKNTVEKYIDLLQQTYIIFRSNSFSRNPRNEIKASHKYFFYDVGIRNAVIEKFDPLEGRDDIGALFENFAVAELMKHRSHFISYWPCYFWRNKKKQEIDYIDPSGGKVSAIEIKWNPDADFNFPQPFMDAYIPSTKIIHRDNFYDHFAAQMRPTL